MIRAPFRLLGKGATNTYLPNFSEANLVSNLISNLVQIRILPIHDHIGHPSEVLVRIGIGRSNLHGIGIKDDDVGPHVFVKQASVLESRRPHQMSREIDGHAQFIAH